MRQRHEQLCQAYDIIFLLLRMHVRASIQKTNGDAVTHARLNRHCVYAFFMRLCFSVLGSTTPLVGSEGHRLR